MKKWVKDVLKSSGITAGLLVMLLAFKGDVNPRTAGMDDKGGHWDTLFVVTASSDDSLTFGFGARTVTVWTYEGSVACQIMGAGTDTLANKRVAGVNLRNNPRSGQLRVAGALIPLGSYNNKTYANTNAIFQGIRLKDNGSPDTVYVEADS